MKYWFLVALVIILLGLIFLFPSYGWELRGWLSPKNLASESVESLTAQNEVLQAELSQYGLIASELPQAPSSSIRAMVYSNYPFDLRNEILLDAGGHEGVSVGKAVLFQGVLVGTVENVFSESATVLTIFDSNLKLPVRIGDTGVDALLQGGAYPAAVSIAKSATVNVGDIVYTAAPGIPYGIPVATVASVSLTPDHLFQQASLNFAYEIDSIQTVEIEK